MKKRWLIAAWIMAVWLAGCTFGTGGGTGGTLFPQPLETRPSSTMTWSPQETGVSAETNVSTETPVSSTQAVTNEPVKEDMTPTAGYEKALEPYVKQAKEDLSRRLSSLSIEEIEVVEARTVVWPDASLGCRQPGMRYIQVPFDGLLVRLRVKGQVFNYHGGGTRGLFLCEETLSGPKPTVPPLDPLSTPPKSEDS